MASREVILWVVRRVVDDSLAASTTWDDGAAERAPGVIHAADMPGIAHFLKFMSRGVREIMLSGTSGSGARA